MTGATGRPRAPRRPRRGAAEVSREAYFENGLKSLGLRVDSASSIFHEWSEAFPAGMFDGHRSVLPAPDHLFYMGLTRCVVQAIYGMLGDNERLLFEVSLRDALSKARLQRTRVVNINKGRVYSGIKISEWASVLAVGPLSFRRVIPIHSTTAALKVVLDVLSKLQALVHAAYYFPRVDLDGADACRARPSHDDLVELSDAFISAVVAACLRSDCTFFAKTIDVPNLHRLREVVAHSIPAMLHVRHSLELAFESAHQFIKRAMRRGNGHNDARRAMVRVVEAELVSRLRLDAAYFGVDQQWTANAGVQEALKVAYPLWSLDSPAWRLSGPTVMVADVTERAARVATRYMGSAPIIQWRKRATRGDDAWVTSGDAVRVLVTSDASLGREFVECSGTLRESGTTVAFFRVVALCSSGHDQAVAIVNPYSEASRGGSRSVMENHFQYLPMLPSVRRALVVHDCDSCQPNEQRRMTHSATNRWCILPQPRSG